MKEFMSITKALADENRVRILMYLRSGELCVCQIIEMLQLAPSTVSKHLAILKQAGLIDLRKKGKWFYYRFPDHPTPTVQGGLNWILESLSNKKQILDEDGRLEKVRYACLAELCNHYSKPNRDDGNELPLEAASLSYDSILTGTAEKG